MISSPPVSDFGGFVGALRSTSGCVQLVQSRSALGHDINFYRWVASAIQDFSSSDILYAKLVQLAHRNGERACISFVCHFPFELISPRKTAKRSRATIPKLDLELSQDALDHVENDCSVILEKVLMELC